MMRHKLIALILSVLSTAPFLSAMAQDVPAQDTNETVRPVTSAFALSAGSAQVADTYLSPLIYRGWNVGFTYSRMQAMKFAPRLWTMELRIALEADRSKNRAGNATMWRANLSADWAMTRRWTLPCSLTLAAGGFTGLNGGAIYTSRNGNNPASAKAAWNVGARAYATYPFRIGRRPVTARWHASLPLLGIFFSPDYGELYYEIWLGNHSGLVHAAWPGNYFSLENEVSLDFGFGSTWLRIGYRSIVNSTKVNDITSRVVTNSAVIGIASEWISADRLSRPSGKTTIISALY